MNNLIKKYRFLLVVVIVALTFFSVLQFSELTTNPGFNDYISSEAGNREYLNKLDTIFGGSEKIILILRSKEDMHGY